MKPAAGRLIAVSLLGAALFAGCASPGPKKTEPELARYLGRKVALCGIEGEESARQIVEVALVNQLMKHGSFELVPRNEIDQARRDPDIDPSSAWQVAKRAGADVALTARVLEMRATEREGYSAVEEEDSQLAAERGRKRGKARRLFKVKTLEGEVKVELRFRDVAGGEKGDERHAVAFASDIAEASAEKSAIHLPPRLGFLEQITQRAFADFFRQYQ